MYGMFTIIHTVCYPGSEVPKVQKAVMVRLLLLFDIEWNSRGYIISDMYGY